MAIGHSPISLWRRNRGVSLRDTPLSNGTEILLEVNPGNSTWTSGVDIELFANAERGFDIPESYRVRIGVQDVRSGKLGDIVANGITEASCDDLTSDAVRFVFAPKLEKEVRLMELEVY